MRVRIVKVKNLILYMFFLSKNTKDLIDSNVFSTVVAAALALKHRRTS